MNNWLKIWDKRITSSNYEDTLEELIRLDGFDNGAGVIKKSDWLEYISWISKICDIKLNDSIFEVGCGCGAFLYPFYCLGHTVGGIDYSSTLIKEIQKLWSQNIQTIYCSEAQYLDSESKYDIVFSNSVFFYFPDYDYAEIVIKKMIEKSKKTIAILEVPDKALYKECEQMRQGNIGEQEYKKKYEGLNHLYFEKKWFIDIGKKYSLEAHIFNQNINNYGNSKFRFNCIYKK